ncbi:MAG: PIN/TRAM domain-containing protein [Candidatus Saccharimonadia bacterium]
MTDTLLIVGAIILISLAALLAVRVMRLSFKNLVLGLSGAIVGLLIGALLSIPLNTLTPPYSSVFPIIITILITLIMIGAFVNQATVLGKILPFMKKIDASDFSEANLPSFAAVVDTSVIIDGRIADIAIAGFIPSVLIVPRFVLAELQNIADSDDAMRRSRGRRGLEVLSQLRTNSDLIVEISDEDLPHITEVDAKLVGLAKKRHIQILTTDYNLNRVAQIEGVRVLNVNELSNAIRPVVLPGEEMLVKVVQPGKEKNQGVGYLNDGTMIVVENGDKLIGKEVATEVTRVFQTVAGKMIFASPKPILGKHQKSSKDKSSDT